jgi:hypothetical protein
MFLGGKNLDYNRFLGGKPRDVVNELGLSLLANFPLFF